MIRQLFIWTVFLAMTVVIVLTTCSNKTIGYSPTADTFTDTSKIKNADSFKKVKTKHSILLPILKGLFITHNQIKWGVIDSSGKEIVPFICDGITAISDTVGIASIYQGSYSLNTGVPRYMYCGKYFFFTKMGRTEKKEKPFSKMVEDVADLHEESFILTSPYQYIPKDTTPTDRTLSFFNPTLYPGCN